MEKSMVDGKHSENETCDGTATPDTLQPPTINGDVTSDDGSVKYRKRRRSADSKCSQASSISSSKLKNLKLIVDKAVEVGSLLYIRNNFY